MRTRCTHEVRDRAPCGLNRFTLDPGLEIPGLDPDPSADAKRMEFATTDRAIDHLAVKAGDLGRLSGRIEPLDRCHLATRLPYVEWCRRRPRGPQRSTRAPEKVRKMRRSSTLHRRLTQISRNDLLELRYVRPSDPRSTTSQRCRFREVAMYEFSAGRGLSSGASATRWAQLLSSGRQSRTGQARR